ncbi:ABC transporter ATP-binding protein/permease [Rhodobacteraceae bacterium NNCM2]|nr:ABC transporter ATP-binding protein/permease [Coraliihabitans acroporae]
MDTRFFTFVWRYSKREQLFILALTFLSFPLVYASLEIPKIIVNDAIDGSDFPQEILGFELEQIPYLLVLCGVFLILVIIINGIKWVMNVAIGMTGERMLRRLRFMLFEHVMRFRMGRFRTTKPGEVIQSMLGEIEPLGGFIGEVIATPAFQGGLLIVYSVFIFAQDWLLGLAAVALYPVQAWMIPKLQARVIRLNKERAANTRALADTISESVSNIADIHTNDTARWHMGQISKKLYSNTVIRLEIFKRKFTIKFINNLINQLTPFFFYSVGGYLVIKGDLDFGSLVAVLAAYKDLAGPWKAVLNFVQRWTDFNSRYVFVVENFVGDSVMEPDRVYKIVSEPVRGPIELTNIEGGPGAGSLTVPQLRIEPGEMVAVTGGANGSREALLEMIAGLVEPATGRVTIGGRQVSDFCLAELGSTVSFIGAEPGMISLTLRDNMLYGLYRLMPDLEGATWEKAREYLSEARATGNLIADPDGDWVDYAAAGVADKQALEARLIALSGALGLAEDLFAEALNGRIPAADADEWTEPVKAARDKLLGGDSDLSDLVEPWSMESYNTNASLLENLLYALPVETMADVGAYARDPAVREVLQKSGALIQVEAIGWDIVLEFAELVDAVEHDSIVLDSFTAYSRDELKHASELAILHGPKGLDKLPPEAKQFVLSLALKFVMRRDRLDVLDESRIGRVLSYRKAAQSVIGGDRRFVGFNEDRFNPSRTIAENLLHGSRRIDRKSRWKQLDAEIEHAIDAAGLRERLMRVGLDRPVGSGGSGLSAAMKRRVALVRAIIKRPEILILDGVGGGDSPADAGLRRVVRKELPSATLIYAAANEVAADGADRTLGLDDEGQMTEIAS